MVRSADLAGTFCGDKDAPKPATAACLRSWVFESEAAGHDNPSLLSISVRPRRDDPPEIQLNCRTAEGGEHAVHLIY